MTQFITPAEAARLVGDDMTLAVSGHAGFGTPDGLFKALHDRYADEGHPRNLTLVKIAGTGDGGQRGGDRLAADGLIGTIITSHFGMEKKLSDKVAAGRTCITAAANASLSLRYALLFRKYTRLRHHLRHLRQLVLICHTACRSILCRVFQLSGFKKCFG